MLACIACTKHEIEDGGGGGGGGGGDASRAASNSSNNPSTKEAVKSLTSQIKEMVLKFSGSSRQCKGGGRHDGGRGSNLSSFRSKSVRHRHPSSYFDDDTGSDAGGQYTYLRAGSSSSTPAWDFTSVNSESRAKWIPGVGMAAAEGDVVLEDNGEPKEWMAQVEPGVHITFMSLPGGAGNDLKRIRFSREMFNKWQAQRWWGENYDRIMELYNVQRFNRQALPTPPRSDDGKRESFYSRVGSTRESPVTPPLNKERLVRSTNRQPPPPAPPPPPPPPPPRPVSDRGVHFPTVPDPSEHILPFYLQPPSGAPTTAAEASSVDASRTTTSSRDEACVSISNASDLEMAEWVEQDEPGVYITIRELADGTRELRRVRFSRERFGEVNAKLWWEQNQERIQSQYL